MQGMIVVRVDAMDTSSCIITPQEVEYVIISVFFPTFMHLVII